MLDRSEDFTFFLYSPTRRSSQRFNPFFFSNTWKRTKSRDLNYQLSLWNAKRNRVWNEHQQMYCTLQKNHGINDFLTLELKMWRNFVSSLRIDSATVRYWRLFTSSHLLANCLTYLPHFKTVQRSLNIEFWRSIKAIFTSFR